MLDVCGHLSANFVLLVLQVMGVDKTFPVNHQSCFKLTLENLSPFFSTTDETY